jgi:hypothetical protein
VLLEERQAVEARRRQRDQEMVAAACSILDAQLARIGKRAAQQCLETLDGHAAMVLAAWPSNEGADYAVTGISSPAGAVRSYAAP